MAEEGAEVKRSLLHKDKFAAVEEHPAEIGRGESRVERLLGLSHFTAVGLRLKKLR
jgi:hypothetical protein